jgi:hypothetical protein
MSASPGGSEARPAVSVWHSPGLNTAINLSWPASLSDRDLSRLALPRRGQVPLALGSVHSPLWQLALRACGAVAFNGLVPGTKRTLQVAMLMLPPGFTEPPPSAVLQSASVVRTSQARDSVAPHSPAQTGAARRGMDR